MPNKLLRKIARRTGLGRLFRTVLSWKNICLVKGPLTYNQDGLATQHNSDFLESEKFIQAYQAGKETGSWGSSDIQWRAYIACWLAQRAMSLEGDFAECGVNRGGLARTVMEFVNFKNTERRFFLLDTYCGVPDESLSSAERKLGRVAGGYDECYDAVRTIFSTYPNAIIIRGAVPSTLGQVDAKRIAYLSLDMNCVEPEIEAAKYFWARMTNGAAILLDDYGWNGHNEQKKAFDIFAHERGTEVLALPTGQGLIFHP